MGTSSEKERMPTEMCNARKEIADLFLQGQYDEIYDIAGENLSKTEAKVSSLIIVRGERGT